MLIKMFTKLNRSDQKDQLFLEKWRHEHRCRLCAWSQLTFLSVCLLLACVCACLHCAFVEVRVSLCWTWRVIAAFVDCWRQVVSHLVTAGKREGWGGFGDRGVLSGGGRDGCTPPINHTWMNSRHRGNGRDWRMGLGQRSEWEIEIKEVLSYFESCLISMCGHARVRVWLRTCLRNSQGIMR